MTWTEDYTKYTFAVLCLLQAGVGATLGILALEPGSKSLAPYPYDYHKLSMDNIADENRHIIEQQDAAVSAFGFNRIAQLVLILSIVSGLVINFPWLWWLGLLLWLLPVGYAVVLVRRTITSKKRLHIYRMVFEDKLKRGWIPLTADVRNEMMLVMTAPPGDVDQLEAMVKKQGQQETNASDISGSH